MKSNNAFETKEKFTKINLADISTVQLTKWIRDETGMTLRDAFLTSNLVEEAFRLGEIRGRALKK